MQHLFVYGTLGPGKPNEHVLSSIDGSWEEGSVFGYLKPLGWGSEMGYPGITLNDSGDEIKGHIFSSKNLGLHWEELDSFEGDEYERILVLVRKKDNSKVRAFIYTLRES